MNPNVLRWMTVAGVLACMGVARADQRADQRADVQLATQADTRTDAAASALAPTLDGEFALQAGDYARAADWYLQAAQAAPDPALAERATGVALLSHQDAVARRALARWRALAPDADGIATADAVLALRGGEGDRARAVLLGIVARNPEGWKDAIAAVITAGAIPAAEQVTRDLVDSDRWPNRIDAWIALGGLAQRFADDALTRRVVAEVVRRFPSDPRARLLQAAQLRDEGDSIGARRAIERALAAPGIDASARAAAAEELASLSDPKAAAAALALGPQTDQTWAARAAYLARADDRAGLQKLCDSLESSKDSALQSRELLLGELAEFLKRDDQALIWYRGVPRGPQRLQAITRSVLVLDRQGKMPAALALLHGLQQDQNESDDVQRSSYMLESQLLSTHKLDEKAVGVLTRALTAFDADPDLLYARALLLEGMGRIAAAEADLRAILDIDPDNAEVMNALGYTLADRTQRFAEARALIERALVQQPDAPAYLDSLGWVQHRQGDDVDAVLNLRRAFALQKDAEIAAHLAEVLWLGGDKDGARRIWKQGLLLEKDNSALQRVIKTYGP